MRERRSLILDPRAERAANSPLEIFTEPAQGPGVYVTSHRYPDPEQEVLSAGGREGKRRSGPPILGNRQIPLEVFALGRRESYAEDPQNLAPNPKGAIDTSSWAGVGLSLGPIRITGPHVNWWENLTNTPPGFDSAISASTDSAGDYAYVPVAVRNGVTYRAAIYVQLQYRSDAAGIEIAVYNAAGAARKATGGKVLSVADTSVEGWYRLDVLFTADATATWRVGVAQTGAGGTVFYATGVFTAVDTGAVVGQTNWALNPFFEIDLAGVASTAIKTERVIDDTFIGAGALLLGVNDRAGSQGAWQDTALLAANQTHTASAYVKARSPADIGRFVRLIFRESGTGIQAQAGVALTAAWQRLSASLRFGAVASSGRIWVLENENTIFEFLTDAWLVEQNTAVAGPFFPTPDQIASRLVGWRGPAHNSASYLLTEGIEPEPYWDGDNAGAKWDGAAGSSTSSQPGDAQRHFEAIIADLEGALAKLQEEGGTFTRPYEAGRLTFDVEGLIGGDEGDYDGRRWTQRGARAGFTLECLPYGRGATDIRTLRSQTTDPVLVFTEEMIPGAVRALGELEIADAAAIPRRGCVAALEVPDYDYTAATAALYYQAESLTLLGDARYAAVAGATGAGNNTIQATLDSIWRAIASTKHAVSGHLTQVGTFRVIARVHANGYVANGELQFRLEWGQGDLSERTTNEPGRILAASAAGFYLVDLGIVRIKKATTGAQRWEGQIIARSYDPAGSDYKPVASIDDLRIAPVGFTYVRARAPRPRLTAPAAFTNRDAFNQAAGNLGGKSADVGGVWATSGAATDFTINTSLHEVLRAATGERVAILPTSIAGATATRCSIWHVVAVDRLDEVGIYIRYVDANNYVRLTRQYDTIRLKVVVAGATVFLREVTVPLSQFHELAGFISASGYVAAYSLEGWWNEIPAGSPLIEDQVGALATGGALTSGKAGLSDNSTNALSWGREYDNFQTWVPPDPALIASGRRLRWRHDGVQREDAAGGDQWSDVGYEGDPLLIPPSTKEKRVLRSIVFPTRGDLDVIPDAGNSDDFTAQLSLVSRHIRVRA